MPSPLDAEPYEVLGVPRDVDDAALRRAYRRRLRETHPDAGGSAAAFTAVQRAWELVGTPSARSDYDSGRPAPGRDAPAWAPAPPRPRRDSRPQARASGHPGGWNRERYLRSLREWVGLGDPIADPYDPVLIRRAPAEIRRLLAAAVVEEDTARALAGLGMGFTIWHDVATDAGKLDHVVLGPTGLWAIQSEDLGGPVTIRRGELSGPDLPPGERPMHELSRRARSIARDARVRFSALAMAVPDDDAEGVEELGRVRGTPALLVEHSRLVDLVRRGLPGVGVGGTDLFELRTRLASAIRFA